MQVNVSLHGLEKVRKELEALSGPQFDRALAKTVNMVAGRFVKDVKEEMRRVFDRPTPYTLRSVQFKPATADRLETTVAPIYMGGKGVDPQQFLKAQAEGGSRRDKRSEKAFRRAGILPGGYQLVIPADPIAGTVDSYGNLKGSFLVQLISYFGAAGEQGYRANMTDKRRAKLANRAVVAGAGSGRPVAVIRGVVYFVSYGRLRGDTLAPGIWAKSGTHGAVVRPAVMFTRSGSYRQRLDLDKVAANTNVSELFARWLRGNIRDEFRSLQSGGGE